MSDEDRIARALCVADGHEPRRWSTLGRTMSRRVARSTARGTCPAWTSYAGEARRFIAAATVLG